MNFLASLVRRQQSTARTGSSTGPTLIDPKDFQYVSGGSPKGTWQKPASTTMSPKGTW